MVPKRQDSRTLRRRRFRAVLFRMVPKHHKKALLVRCRVHTGKARHLTLAGPFVPGQKIFKRDSVLLFHRPQDVAV